MTGPGTETSTPISPRINLDRHALRHAWRAELGMIARLSAPIILTNLTQMLMGTTDLVMMGWLGPDVLAAGALGVNMYFFVMIFGIGLVSAAAPLIANALGRSQASAPGHGDDDPANDVRRTVQQGFRVAACVAVPAWGLLWWTQALLRRMGQDPDLAAAAGTYMHALQWAMLPFLAYLVLRAFVSALGRPGWSLAVGAGAVLVNAAGNWCLMLGHCGIAPMGIAGSGLATLIASVLMFAALAAVVMCDPQFRAFRLFDHWWRADWPRFRTFTRLGLPMAATLGFEVTIFNAAVFLMGLIGPAELAAHAIAIQLAALSFMVPLGIGQAATIRVGLAHGAGDGPGITRAGWSALALGLGYATAASAVMVVYPRLLIGLFLDTSNPATAHVVALAQSFLALAALFQIVDGAQGVASGMLRGLQDARVPMLFALGGYWGLGLPVGALLAFPLHLGGRGIWIGLALGLASVATLMVWRWTWRQRLGLVDAGGVG